MNTETLSILSLIISSITAGGAFVAILINRWNAKEAVRAQINTGARASRAAVVSANRQRWIDALRDDIAEFISARRHLCILQDSGGKEGFGQGALLGEQRTLTAKIIMLRARVEMRLNPNEDEHEKLLELMDNYEAEPRTVSDLALRTKARSIFKSEWDRLKKEASGVDPYVREVSTVANG